MRKSDRAFGIVHCNYWAVLAAGTRVSQNNTDIPHATPIPYPRRDSSSYRQTIDYLFNLATHTQSFPPGQEHNFLDLSITNPTLPYPLHSHPMTSSLQPTPKPDTPVRVTTHDTYLITPPTHSLTHSPTHPQLTHPAIRFARFPLRKKDAFQQKKQGKPSSEYGIR